MADDDPSSSAASLPVAAALGRGRPWVLNADGTRAEAAAAGGTIDEGEDGMEEDDLASPDTLLARILHPTAPGPPAPFAGFEVRWGWVVGPLVLRPPPDTTR